MRLGRVAEAERSAQELRNRAEKLPAGVELRRYHHLAGEMALAAGRPAAAVAELETARAMLTPRGLRRLDYLPDHVPIWYSLAAAYLAAGDVERAEEHWRKILDSTLERVFLPVP